MGPFMLYAKILTPLSLFLLTTLVHPVRGDSKTTLQTPPECSTPNGSTSQSDSAPALCQGTTAQSRGKKPCPCPLRDEGEGEGEGEPEAMAGTAAHSGASGILRHIVPISTAALILVLGFSSAGSKLRGRTKTILLALCAALALGNYTDFGRWSNNRYVNSWEFFHYYLGSKYLPELGYTRLYTAALIADEETGRKFSHKKNAIRNLATGGCIPVDEVLKQRDAILARFSPERWTEFTQDILYFKKELSEYRWNGIFHDKGYNATPVWSTIAGPMTNRTETSRPSELLALSLIDPLLMACAIIAVWRAFGFQPAMLMVVLIGTHMTMSHTHMKGALLRTDWIMSLVLGICAVKCARPALGGALVAYAATSRVFPVILAFAPFAHLLITSIRRKPQSRPLVRFCVGFSVVLGLLLSASLLFVGPAHWLEFANKIWQHNDSFSPWRVGFKHLFLGAYEYRADQAGTHQEVFHNRWMVWWMIQSLVLVGTVALSKRLKDWETLALGFVPTFFLVAPTYYYYMMLVVPLLFFAGRINRPECTIGTAWLLVSSSIAYVVYDSVGRELPLFYVLSCMILGVCALMCLSALLQGSPNARPAPALSRQASSSVLGAQS